MSLSGFGIFARTELPRSVYDHEVLADAPEFRWRFNEKLAEGDEERVALNDGTVGTAANGTYVGGISFNAEAMIVGDPGQGIAATSADVFAGVVVAGVNIPVAQINLLSRVNSRAPFTLEVWVRPKVGQTQALIFFMRDPTGTISSFPLFWFNDTGAGNSGEFMWRLAKGAANSDLESGNSSAPPGARYHLVITGEQEGANLRRRLYLNGTQVATDTVATNNYDSTGVDHNKWAGGVVAGSNFMGDLQEGAIYLQALSATRVLAHHTAGTAPWQGDLPGVRLGRILDLAGVPAAMREIDAGVTTLQSADFGG